MVTPLDVIPSLHQALRNDMKIIDDPTYKVAAEGSDLSIVVERLRIFSEILMWHVAGEDELVFPAMDKVAPLVMQGYLHDDGEFDIMTEGWAKMAAA